MHTRAPSNLPRGQAHWFQHIAPQFTRDGYEAVALSYSGHGDSGTRPKLGRGWWEKEVIRVCEHAGLLHPNRVAKPVLVGHSMGSFVAQDVARFFPQHVSGIVVLDGGIPHPLLWSLPHAGRLRLVRGSPPPCSTKLLLPPPFGPVWPMRVTTPPLVPRPGGDGLVIQKFTSGAGKPRSYPMSTLPKDRLRMTPPQGCIPYIQEHIANASVKPSSSQAGETGDVCSLHAAPPRAPLWCVPDASGSRVLVCVRARPCRALDVEV